MKESQFVLVVGATPNDPNRDEEFNQWYDAHTAVLGKIPGVTNITRYKIAKWPLYDKNNHENYPRYLALYELDGEAALKAWEKDKGRTADLAEVEKQWGKKDANGNRPGITFWGHVLYERVEPRPEK